MKPQNHAGQHDVGRRVAFLGATRGMGRALARRMAEAGDALFLLGREAAELERSAADLEAYGARGQVGHALCDLEQPDSFAPALDAAVQALGGLDVVVLTAGIFASQQALEDDAELLARLLRVDFTHSVLFCEEARRRLLAHGGGTLCVFSSVAGERGRKPVVLYGASKAGLSSYLEGLDHRYRAEGLRVLTVKPAAASTPKVPSSTTGTASVGISVARRLPRNRYMTRKTRTIASNSVLTTSSIEMAMNGVVS